MRESAGVLAPKPHAAVPVSPHLLLRVEHARGAHRETRADCPLCRAERSTDGSTHRVATSVREASPTPIPDHSRASSGAALAGASWRPAELRTRPGTNRWRLVGYLGLWAIGSFAVMTLLMVLTVN
jgi:hypothetical protein